MSPEGTHLVVIHTPHINFIISTSPEVILAKVSIANTFSSVLEM